MKRTILIIEDNDSNRLLLRDLLSYYGYGVLEATDGVEGVRLARECRPDLVLMDIQMPTLGGLAAVRMLKADLGTGHLKIIAITSFAMRGDREKILAAGFDDYIAKPIDTRALPLIVKSHLESGSEA